MMATGIVDRALSSLAASGITTGLYANVERIHRPLCMRRLTRRARRCGHDHRHRGGSSLDVKAGALLLPGHQTLAAAYGVGNAVGPRLPDIGADNSRHRVEVTPISIITTGKSEKMGVVSPIILQISRFWIRH